MMWFISFMQKRPSDITIRTGRVLFGLILIWAFYYNLVFQWDAIENVLFWQTLSTENILTFKYILVWLWIIPLIMWAIKMCFLKKKYMRFIQIAFWIFLFYISSIIVEWPELDLDSLIVFMWFLPLVAWITGKCIPSYCMKFAEKITKIRV